MADSGATRTRRYKLHKRGDHRECRDCDALSGPAPFLVPGDAPAAPVDARASLEALCRRLEAAHVADPANALIARELRACLLTLPAPETPGDDPLAELLALDADVP